MSLIDKQLFLRTLEEKLGDIVTANDRARILAAADEALAGFELTGTKSEDVDSDSQDLLRIFLDAKRVEGRSEKTVERYRHILSKLLSDVRVPFAKMTVFHIRAWFSNEQARGIKATTLEGTRTAFTSFFGWLSREGLIQKNPTNNLPAIKRPKVVRKPYTPTELAKLENAARDPRSSRNLAIILFLAATGCRISEMCGLDRDDLDLQRQCVTVLGKGAKERLVYFDEVSAMYLRSYLAERDDDLDPLFVGLRGDRLSPSGVQQMLRRIARKAGVENVHPHRFRRTRATSLIDHGMPIQEVATVLGHENIDTTMTYIYIDEKKVAANFQRYA